MKVSKQSVARSIDQPDPAVRFYLLHGPDDGQSRALGARLLEALGAEKVIIAAGAVKSDPALIASEAAAISLFGGRRLIWIEPASEDIAEGVRALLEIEATESAVVAIAGALRKTSELLKLAEASPRAVAFAAYPPEGAEADRMVIDVGRRFGLKCDPRLANRIAESCGNDQALVAQEMQKLALYVDASPQTPKPLDVEALDAVGAELSEGNIPRVADLALAGDLKALTEELAKLPTGAEGIPVVRALQRRLMMLAPARARMERGDRLDAVMTSLGKSLFWKDKEIVGRMLSRWNAAGLARIAERAAKLERTLIFSRSPERESLGEELLSIARAARSRR